MKLDLSAGVEVDIKIYYDKNRISCYKNWNSSFFNDDGGSTQVTVLKVEDCIVSNIKTFEKHGYNGFN